VRIRQLSLWLVAGAALVALPFVYREPYHLHLIILILIWSFAYTSWSMMGRFNLVSLGHGGFMGVGAYVTALLWNHLGVSPWLGIPVAMFAAAILAVVVGYPCFRFRITGHYFVLVTLALSGIVLQVITATRDYTGGSLGYTPDRTRGSHLLALQFDDKLTWYLIALGVWAAGLAIWQWVDRSMDRYALEAISEDEDAAAAAGVNVTWEKLKITVISALMTSLAGALYCQYQMFISPDTVSGISVSLQMVFAVIVGGLYVSLGPTIGAIITIVLAEILRIVPGSSLVVCPSDKDLAAPEMAAGLEESFGGGGYTAVQRSALLQMAWDHVSSALDGRESAFELHASGGIPAWRGRLRRSFERYNELANAVAARLDMPMPAIDLERIREVPWAPRRNVTPPGPFSGTR